MPRLIYPENEPKPYEPDIQFCPVCGEEVFSEDDYFCPDCDVYPEPECPACHDLGGEYFPCPMCGKR